LVDPIVVKEYNLLNFISNAIHDMEDLGLVLTKVQQAMDVLSSSWTNQAHMKILLIWETILIGDPKKKQIKIEAVTCSF